MDPYATRADLDDFVSDDLTVPADPEATRLLTRASEVLDDHITATFAVDDATGLPTDTDVAKALTEACCAQVEYWLELGGTDGHDIVGPLGAVDLGSSAASFEHGPGVLAPRAARRLRQAGLT